MNDLQISRPSACRWCRRRKIRCDGGKPCSPCARRASLVCEYLPSKSSLARSEPELPKGAACAPCRQRKRKCDGMRPCLPCKNRSCADLCKYRGNSQGRECGSGRGENSSVGMSEVDIPLGLEPVVIPKAVFPTNLHSTFMTSLSGYRTSGPTEHETAAELLSLRILFLNDGWEYGLNVSRQKREAMARGDTSGTVVHPIFIPVCHLVGYVLASHSTSARWNHLKGQTAAAEAVQSSLILQILESPTAAPDPLTCVQVYKLLAIYTGQKGDLRGFQEFLGSAANAILRHENLLGLEDSVAPVQDIPVRKLFEEGQSALAHMVYVEMAAGIGVKTPPNLPPVLQAKFGRLAE
ncbi:hypothetical protein B0H17DRAFT_1057467 [Mycena rosella]|uniref:Zn(2)-C6 fungal-type domain-containing protein n=1 Tax=Mycena rosella TaxID=1033263 RepID=A0AAD7DL67_MYCRO|nr:hypothetical protein B0H17DRAFT_1057467 [Mycena rosella]